MTLPGPASAPLDLLPTTGAGRHAAPEPQEHSGRLTLLTADLERVPAPDGPVAVKLRIASGGRQLRRLRRLLAQSSDPAATAGTEAAIRTLVQNLHSAHARRSSAFQLVPSSDFEPGDQVRYLSAWYDVLAVGPVGLTVRSRRMVEDGSGTQPGAAAPTPAPWAASATAAASVAWAPSVASAPSAAPVRSARSGAPVSSAASAVYTKVTGRLRNGVEEVDVQEDADAA